MHPNKIKKQSLGELLDKAWDCIARNNLTQAKKYIDMASSSEPDNVRVRFFSGVLEYKKQNYLKSISILQALLDEYPTHGDAHVNIGSAYSESGMLDKAEYHYRKALELRPDDHIALNNLAGLCRKQMRLAEAQMLFNKSIEIEPNFWQSHFNLGGLFIARKMISKSVDHFRAAFKLNKNSNTYASLIGSLKHDYFEEANELAKEVASFKKPDFSILSAFPILVHSCEWEIVDKIQDKVLKVACAEQRYANWVQSILLPLNKLHDVSREDVFKVHKAWGNMMHRPKDAYIEHKKAMKPSAHINIGYLSADFREHSVGHFIRNIISNHDKTRFKIFCYATYSKEDEITKEIRSYSTSYAQVHALTDIELAEKIYDDGIHILVDLNGHTAHTRVEMLRYCPAPVQITYLGYPNTTGLDMVDYRITDTYAESKEGTLYTEELLYMPESFLCFGSFIEQEIKNELPVQRNGYVTFGSFNNISKLNKKTIKVWSEILHKVPDSRLIIKSGNMEKGFVQSNVRNEFIKHGIYEDRLDLKGFYVDKRIAMDCYNEIDIALDTFPYQGTTTTCEALWMDVPVVSLVGHLHEQRVSHSIYKNIGVEDCLAYTEDEYINIAVSLAADTQKNIELRKKIHTGLRESILCNPERFTKQMEELYKQAWIAKLQKLPWTDFKDEHTPEDSQLQIKIDGGVTICVPDDLNLAMPYILLEQEGWIEPEYDFIQHVFIPGMSAVDIGANYGIYTVLAASKISPNDKVWAIEPNIERANYIRGSLKCNNLTNVNIQSNISTLDEYLLENDWKNIDFIRLDIEEFDEKYFIESKGFFISNSPLIMIRTGEKDRMAQNILNHLSSLEYDNYLLIPGLNLLAPYKLDNEIDSYRMNLFCCKSDCAEKLSQRGLLVKEDQLSMEVIPHQAGQWVEHLQQFPYVTRLLKPWLSYMESHNNSEQWALHQNALDYYAMAHRLDETAGNRYIYLRHAYNILVNLINLKGNFSNIQSFVRIANELGERTQAVSALEYLISQYDSGVVVTFDEPFLCVSADYEMIDPEEMIMVWVNASILVQYEKKHVFSSYFSEKSSLNRLDKLKEIGFANCEMERRRQLIRLRFNLQQEPENKFFEETDCNQNDWFWSGGKLS